MNPTNWVVGGCAIIGARSRVLANSCKLVILLKERLRMRVMGVNGSPRKNWNTSTLVNEALKGAQSKGAGIELINLYDLEYKGCISCFTCKRKGVVVEQCTIKDALFPVFEKIRKSDAIILGSPIYLGCVSGEMRSFMERLLFPYISYDKKPSSFGKKIKTAFIYTMNVPEAHLEVSGYNKMFNDYEKTLERIFGNSETLIATETYQFDDYSKYAVAMFDSEQRAKRHESVFKLECQKAYKMGERLTVESA
jgi:multimeric flavodoxin WrbA